MIKKLILSATAVVAIGLFSGYTIYRNHQNRPDISEIMKANIEALSDPEIIIGPICASISEKDCGYEDVKVDGKIIYP